MTGRRRWCWPLGEKRTERSQHADQKISERCTAKPAMTPSAAANVTVCAPRVMSPAAYTPGTVVIFSPSVRMIGPDWASSSSQPSRFANFAIQARAGSDVQRVRGGQSPIRKLDGGQPRTVAVQRCHGRGLDDNASLSQFCQ